MRFRLWSALLPATSPQGERPAATCDAGHIRVLYVQDGVDAAASVRALENDGFEVVHERTGESGFFRASTEKFDVAVLSAALPVRGGLEVLGALRAQGVTTPVLLLAIRATVDDRVAALDAGADDCVEMVVAPPELHARVRALARRGTTNPVRLCAGDMELDPMARAAWRAGRPLQLTFREFQLLEYFVRHQGEVLTREQICHDVWQGRPAPTLDNALDVHIARLRRKVDGDAPVRLIHTVRGVGFAFGEAGALGAGVRTRR